MLLIFNLSSQVAEQSNQLSTGIAEIIDNVVKKVDSNLDINLESLNHLVRKNAHFIAYLILGMLVVNALRRSGTNRHISFLLAQLICIVYAASDEIHQMYVPGRSTQVTDVVIDSTGAFLGIGIYWCASKMKNKKIHNRVI